MALGAVEYADSTCAVLKGPPTNECPAKTAYDGSFYG